MKQNLEFEDKNEFRRTRCLWRISSEGMRELVMRGMREFVQTEIGRLLSRQDAGETVTLA